MPSSFTDQEVQTLIDAAANLIDTVYSTNNAPYGPHGPVLMENNEAVRDALHKLTRCNVRAICGECDVTNLDPHSSALLLAAQNDWCSFCYDTLSHREECNKVHPPLRAS